MKIRMLLMMLLLTLTLIACQEDVVIQLDVPSNFTIESSTLSFDVVENASRYRIETFDVNTEVTKKYFVTEDQDLSKLFFPPGTYEIKIQAVGDGKVYLDSAFSTAISYVQEDPYQVSEITGEFLTDDIKIRWFGRNAYQTATNANYFYFTASGFEVKFHGTELQAELLTGTNPVGKEPHLVLPVGKEPHLVLFIDGNNNPEEGTVLVLDQIKKTYTLVSGLEEGEHTVRVLKRSESIDSLTGLSKITTDGYFMDTDPLRTRKIEVIAASSSAGFGNLAANTNESKSTQNSDGLRAYAYLASRMLDAEINIFSASGWPLLKGPWTGSNNIPSAYKYVDVYSTVEWNHQLYSPDLIIINLGTNDWSYITSLSSAEKTQALLNFENAFVAFIGELHSIHPNAAIAIAYGLMNETNIYTPTVNVYNQAKLAYPELDLFKIQLPSVNAQEGIGSSSHPGLLTHIRAGGELAEAIAEWLDWNIVYPNIDQE